MLQTTEFWYISEYQIYLNIDNSIEWLLIKFLHSRAPELIFGATDYTTNIDVWSAGCVFAGKS